MICPNCNSENSDSAKFCKKCGTPLSKKEVSHEGMINSINKEKSNDNTKLIIAALVIIAVVLAGAFIYVYGFGNNDSQASDNQVVQENTNQSVNEDSNSEPAQATQTQQTSTPQTTPMSILGGTFSTGSGLSDKTYASIYVGPEHAGENVDIQIFYSRDGSTLNDGNVVSKTVSSDGYIEVSSADAYKYYPDFAEIYLYDTSGNLLDTQSVNLSPSSGSQSF